MAPDADKLRQRKTATNHAALESLALNVLEGEVLRGNDVDEQSTETMATSRNIATIDQLYGHEVCIDGIIYDLTNFQHPGGDTIKMFGGNDVTVQYRMIHPYHTAHHLNKLTRVGKVLKYQPEYVLLYYRFCPLAR
jgi:cytochrome b involved in lipid metabolism